MNLETIQTYLDTLSKGDIDSHPFLSDLADSVESGNTRKAYRAFVDMVADSFSQSDVLGSDSIEKDWAAFKAAVVKEEPAFAKACAEAGWDDMLRDIKKDLEGEADDEYLGIVKH